MMRGQRRRGEGGEEQAERGEDRPMCRCERLLRLYLVRRRVRVCGDPAVERFVREVDRTTAPAKAKHR